MFTRLRRTHIALLCAPLLVCGLSAASAADKPAQTVKPAKTAAVSERPGPLGHLDANGDGSVDLSELTARDPSLTAAEFGALDTNHDGLLSRDELRDAFPKLRFMRLDTNKDGAVSKDEARAEAVRNADAMFKRLDKDGNGQLTADEMQRERGDRMHGHAPPR